MKLHGGYEVGGMGLSDGAGVTVRKVSDHEVRFDVIFYPFLLAEKKGQCLPAQEPLQPRISMCWR
jgi:hypothetical protein